MLCIVYLLLFLAYVVSCIERTLPGPKSIPKIGNLKFIYSSVTGQLIPYLKEIDNEYGSKSPFMLSTGPLVQVWCSNTEKNYVFMSTKSTCVDNGTMFTTLLDHKNTDT